MEDLSLKKAYKDMKFIQLSQDKWDTRFLYEDDGPKGITVWRRGQGMKAIKKGIALASLIQW